MVTVLSLHTRATLSWHVLGVQAKESSTDPLQQVSNELVRLLLEHLNAKHDPLFLNSLRFKLLLSTNTSQNDRNPQRNCLFPLRLYNVPASFRIHQTRIKKILNSLLSM